MRDTGLANCIATTMLAIFPRHHQPSSSCFTCFTTATALRGGGGALAKLQPGNPRTSARSCKEYAYMQDKCISKSICMVICIYLNAFIKFCSCDFVIEYRNVLISLNWTGAVSGGAPRSGRTPLSFRTPQTPEPSAFYKFKFFKKINNIHHYRMILRCIIFLSIFL